MTPPKPAPESPFEFAISQLTPEVKPHVLKTMHGLISSVLTSTLISPTEDRNEQAAESRALAKLLRTIETNLGGASFSAVSPKEQVKYVTPSQLPVAAAGKTTSKKQRRVSPRGKPQP